MVGVPRRQRQRWDPDVPHRQLEMLPNLAQVFLALGEACLAQETPRQPCQGATWLFVHTPNHCANPLSSKEVPKPSVGNMKRGRRMCRQQVGGEAKIVCFHPAGGSEGYAPRSAHPRSRPLVRFDCRHQDRRARQRNTRSQGASHLLDADLASCSAVALECPWELQRLEPSCRFITDNLRMGSGHKPSPTQGSETERPPQAPPAGGGQGHIVATPPSAYTWPQHLDSLVIQCLHSDQPPSSDSWVRSGGSGKPALVPTSYSFCPPAPLSQRPTSSHPPRGRL